MENDVPLRSVDRYDGQVVWIRRHGACYELGSYLGSGAAGVVYEAVTNACGALDVMDPLSDHMMIDQPYQSQCPVNACMLPLMNCFIAMNLKVSSK